ncbi:hypothetical protein T4B_6369 [Trichinella pseudospiralis]|uniref:Uncharacterized protein n=1 Tax=Trichinella pseudospiralis TaxID=6337 RepID=A0A0V1GEK5_TRIPS|nr:hypothetical protein T4B_6369 [Trichinella pseudospiralis]
MMEIKQPETDTSPVCFAFPNISEEAKSVKIRFGAKWNPYNSTALSPELSVICACRKCHIVWN